MNTKPLPAAPAAGATPEPPREPLAAADPVKVILDGLGDRLIVLVGLMASGKTSVGRLLAGRLDVRFVDADEEIETAAAMTIPEIFERHGEPYFRSGEKRVISRILKDGPRVLATGGGAFMNEETRASIRERGVSIWLRADLDTLMRRARRRANRPLLKTDDPVATMKNLIDLRYPIYAEANIVIESQDGPHDETVNDVIAALATYFSSVEKKDVA